MMASLNALARKMLRLVQAVSKENADRSSPDREDKEGRPKRQMPELPLPALGSYGACSDYIEQLKDHRDVPSDLEDGVMKMASEIRRSDPSDVRAAWDTVLVSLVMTE